MWTWPLDSTIGAITAHRVPERVVDGTRTQVWAWMTNKCRGTKKEERRLQSLPPLKAFTTKWCLLYVKLTKIKVKVKFLMSFIRLALFYSLLLLLASLFSIWRFKLTFDFFYFFLHFITRKSLCLSLSLSLSLSFSLSSLASFFPNLMIILMY